MPAHLSIAVLLPKEIKKQLHRLCFGIPEVSWTDEDNLHLTLVHAGPNDGQLEIDLHESLSEIRFHPLALQLKGINYFKSKSTASTLWTGVKESNAFSYFMKTLNEQLNATSLSLPKTGLASPHVTLGRTKRIDPFRLNEYLTSHLEFESTSFTVDSFVLLESRITKENTMIHSEIARYM